MRIASMFMAASIQCPNINTLYDFSTYFSEEIHKCLVALKNGEIGVRFWWYSLFMHMFLYKGAYIFGKDMELKRVVDGVVIPIQSWTSLLDRHD